VFHISKPIGVTALAAAVITLFAGWYLVNANAQNAVRDKDGLEHGYVPFADAPISYRTHPIDDPVKRLQDRLDAGKVKLEYEPQNGYLRSVLKLLTIPVDSQTLVFSKTSFQYKKISPEYPRALYFNDDVYIGKVHDGAGIEVVSFDANQGAIFYLLDEHKTAHPTFKRVDLECTQCHIAANTRGVPGVFLRSIYTRDSGEQEPATKSYVTDQDSPFNERWGGWYITGKYNGFQNMGNAATEENKTGAVEKDVNLHILTPKFNSSEYLIPDSDIVAHLVLAHQTQMHNLITLANYRTRLALFAQQNNTSGAAQNNPSAVINALQRPVDQLLRYLLFANETPLPQPIGGSSNYEKDFSARGPRDSKGRSLRDFDLQKRIFRYPCSYLIYSEDFDAIPEPTKGYIYHRLFEIFTGKDQGDEFARLSAEDRRAILEILLETKAGLPEEWRNYAKFNHILLAANRPLVSRKG